MYEAGDSRYMDLLIGNTDLNDFLNGGEYRAHINTYDANILDNLKKAREKIEKLKARLKKEEKALEKKQAKYEKQQKKLEELSEEKREKLKEIGIQIDNKEDEINRAQEEERERLAKELQEKMMREAAEKVSKQQEQETQPASSYDDKWEDEDQGYDNPSENDEDISEYEDDDNTDDNNVEYEEDSYENDTDIDEDDTDEENNTSSSSEEEDDEFIWPCNARYITSDFGYRDAPTAGATSYHRGIDIGASYGDSAWAAAGGIVETTEYNSAMGNYVVIDHGNGIRTYYEHLDSFSVNEGEYVSQGDKIGVVGSTGIATGPHLHFGVNVYGDYTDPLSYVTP